MARIKLPTLLLFTAVIIGITLRMGLAATKQTVTHDEMISYQVTTANLPALQSRWLSQLPNGAIYISDLSYDNDVNGRGQILAILSQRFEVVPVPGGVWGLGQIYLLQEN